MCDFDDPKRFEQLHTEQYCCYPTGYCIKWFQSLRAVERDSPIAANTLTLLRDRDRQVYCSSADSNYCCKGMTTANEINVFRDDGIGRDCQKASEYAKDRKGEA